MEQRIRVVLLPRLLPLASGQPADGGQHELRIFTPARLCEFQLGSGPVSVLRQKRNHGFLEQPAGIVPWIGVFVGQHGQPQEFLAHLEGLVLSDASNQAVGLYTPGIGQVPTGQSREDTQAGQCGEVT